MARENPIPEKQISEFVDKLKQAAGSNLESIILFGSAATGEYETDYSNINLMVVLKDASFSSLIALAPVVESWTQQRRPAPMLITQDELERSADVFSIELMDMKRQHRVLFGVDVVGSLQIPMVLHRAQLEYELREKLILLRQRLLVDSRDETRTWHLLLHSLPAFATLFRHALITQGQPEPGTKRDSIKALATMLGFDTSPFENLLDIREHVADPKQFRVQDVAARYLAAVEQVTAAVDRMLDTPGR